MVRTEIQATGAVICLQGEHDAFTAGALSEAIAAATARGEGDLVIDLRDVSFLSVATVGVICQAREVLRAQSRSMVLRSPSPRAQRVLDLCGVADRFEPSSAVSGGP